MLGEAAELGDVAAVKLFLDCGGALGDSPPDEDLPEILLFADRVAGSLPTTLTAIPILLFAEKHFGIQIRGHHTHFENCLLVTALPVHEK